MWGILKYKKLHPDAKIDLPVHKGDVGYDIYSVSEIVILPHTDAEVPIGLALDLPNHYYCTIETRSGHGIKKGLRVHRGIIDNGYKGDISIRVYNHRDVEYVVKKGEKIAQLILHKIEVFPLQETQELTSSARGTNGFGSTDKS